MCKILENYTSEICGGMQLNFQNIGLEKCLQWIAYAATRTDSLLWSDCVFITVPLRGSGTVRVTLFIFDMI